MKSFTFKKFNSNPLLKNVSKAYGSYLYCNNEKYFDLTSGYPNITVLGYNNEKVNLSIKHQMKKFTHLNPNICDYKLKEKLSKNLTRRSPKTINKVYYSGTSGSDSVEAAIKLSTQYHKALGFKNKNKVISRNQSYHGSTYETLSLSDTPVLNLYKSNCSLKKYIKIESHNPINNIKENQSIEEYTKNSIKEFKDSILFHGQENITAFVAETIMGNFAGNIEPHKSYWKSMYNICKKNNINLILDEIYCGLGRSGEIYSFKKYNIEPEFVCLSKSLTNGTIPFSVVLTKSIIEKTILNKFGRVFHGHTFQANALGVAAANTVMSIINEKKFLKNVKKKSIRLKNGLEYLIKNFDIFEKTYGIGMMQTLKFNKSISLSLGSKIQKNMLIKKNYLLDTRFNRVSFTPNLNISDKEIDKFINSFESYLKKEFN